MLTFFSTPKPFQGHINMIQRNALRSWLLVHPQVEVLLFGDDSGAAEACEELGIRHIPRVRKNSHGTKYLASIYDQAQQLARHDLLCHVNCDIILMDDFAHAVERAAQWNERFLLAGRRWDVDVRQPLSFDRPEWRKELRELALRSNRQRPPQWIDYFLFPKGLYHNKIPDFVIGRPGWDNWLLWFALNSGAKLIDASSVVTAVHQNHDYAYHPDGEKGVWEGEEAQQNYRLLDAYRKFRTLENATHFLEPEGLRRNHLDWLAQFKRNLRRSGSTAWFKMLDVTRPVRHTLGFRQKGKIPS